MNFSLSLCMIRGIFGESVKTVYQKIVDLKKVNFFFMYTMYTQKYTNVHQYEKKINSESNSPIVL